MTTLNIGIGYILSLQQLGHFTIDVLFELRYKAHQKCYMPSIPSMEPLFKDMLFI